MSTILQDELRVLNPSLGLAFPPEDAPLEAHDSLSTPASCLLRRTGEVHARA